MNYYEARQRSDKTGWHFTCQNDDQIWPVGDCQDHEPHATREEAEECFLRYLLDDISEEQYGNWGDCEICGAPTKLGLTARRPLGNGFRLCDEHRSSEVLAGLTAWPSRIVASY
jgi:hypothetical protein